MHRSAHFILCKESAKWSNFLYVWLEYHFSRIEYFACGSFNSHSIIQFVFFSLTLTTAWYTDFPFPEC